jgi:hypothetical protein
MRSLTKLIASLIVFGSIIAFIVFLLHIPEKGIGAIVELLIVALLAYGGITLLRKRQTGWWLLVILFSIGLVGVIIVEVYWLLAHLNITAKAIGWEFLTLVLIFAPLIILLIDPPKRWKLGHNQHQTPNSTGTSGPTP